MPDLTIAANRMCRRIDTLTGDTDAGEAIDHLNRGYIRALTGKNPADPEGGAHRWSFLRPQATITFWPSVAVDADNTVTCAATTLTAESASFYASMVGKTITIDETDYVIDSYTSSTVVELTTSQTIDAKTWAMTADGTYQLPDDFGGMVGPFVYEYSSSELLGPLKETDYPDMDVRQRDSSSTGTPSRWCIVPRSIVSTGQRSNIITNPTTDAARTVRYRYRRRPDRLTDEAIYPLGNETFHWAVECAGLSEAEFTIAHEHGLWETRYREAIAAAMDDDQTAYGVWDVAVNMSDV